MSNSYCIHELPDDQCGLCKRAPEGINEIVFTTQGGQVFHNWRDCAFLVDGQNLATSRGQQNHPIQPIKWSVVFYSLGACEWCCTRYHLRDKTPIVCNVLIDGKWHNAQYLQERFISTKKREHQVILSETNKIVLVNEKQIRF